MAVKFAAYRIESSIHLRCIYQFNQYPCFFTGYDLNQVNLYVSKLFENVGSLVFEEAAENEKYNFTITGVQSELGEKLEFQQVWY